MIFKYIILGILVTILLYLIRKRLTIEQKEVINSFATRLMWFSLGGAATIFFIGLIYR